MRSISGLNFFLAAALFLVSGMPAAVFAGSWENFSKAVVEKYEESSAPLFSPDAPEAAEKPKGDPFFDEVRKKNMEFTKEEQARRREFIEKVRGKNWTDEKRQQELAAFQKKELERRQKFIGKQQEKIQKHQEGRESIWTELF